MAYSGLELLLHRAGTKRFIAADPTIVALRPRNVAMINGTKVATSTVVRDPQTFKVIWAGDNGVVRYPSDISGGVRRFDFILLGEWDAIIEIGDYWNVDDQRFEIEYIFPDNGYEVKAGGVSHGASPT